MSTKGKPDGRYSLPAYDYRMSAGNVANVAYDAEYDPRVEQWRNVSAAFQIVSPQGVEGQVEYFDHVISKEIEEDKRMNQAEFLAWLESPEVEYQTPMKGCRGLL